MEEMKSTKRTILALAVSACVLLAGAGTAGATDTSTWRWNRRHAVKTWVWEPVGEQCTLSSDGSSGWCNLSTSFRVQNVETRRTTGSCKVRVVVWNSGNKRVTAIRWNQVFDFSVARGETSPDQSMTSYYGIGPDWETRWDSRPAWCEWNGTRIRWQP
jgi:hypothetical protein